MSPDSQRSIRFPSLNLLRLLNALPLLRGVVPPDSLSTRTLICDNTPQKGAPIFVTVHGTWATRSTWTHPDSQLIRTLRAAWPQSGFYRFEWSGVNGARHRLAAAARLRVQLDQLSLSHPMSKIVAVSHSHGGNVVAWASTCVDFALSAAVYLNTPFIHVLGSKLRSRNWSSGEARWGLFGMCMFVVMLLMYPLLLFTSNRLVQFAVACLVMVAVWLWWWVLDGPDYIKGLANELEYVSTGKRHVARELVVNAIGDEAGPALGGVYFGQWLIRRVLKLSLIVIVLIYLAAMLLEIFKPTSPAYTINKELLYVLLPGALVLVFLSALLAVSGYGALQGLVSLDSPVTVTAAPLGHADIVTAAWTHQRQLQHSAIYESPEVSAAIVEWLTPLLNTDQDV